MEIFSQLFSVHNTWCFFKTPSKVSPFLKAGRQKNASPDPTLSSSEMSITSGQARLTRARGRSCPVSLRRGSLTPLHVHSSPQQCIADACCEATGSREPNDLVFPSATKSLEGTSLRKEAQSRESNKGKEELSPFCISTLHNPHRTPRLHVYIRKQFTG